MKKIISFLIVTALLLAAVVAIIPASAEEAEPQKRESILVNSQPDQYNGIGPAFYYDYRLYTHNVNYFPINEAPREDGGTGYQGKRPYMLRSRNSSGGSSTSIDGSLDSYISADAYNTFQRGYELNFITDDMGNDYEFDAWLGVCLRETKTIDAFSFYTLHENSPSRGSKYLIEELTLFGAKMDPETHTFGTWFRMTDAIGTVQTNITEDGNLAVVTGDLYMPFEVDYIFMAFQMEGEGDGEYLCVELEAYEYEGGAAEELDLAELNEAVAAAEDELAKEGTYTSKSFNTLQLAYDSAKNTLATATTQKAVDHAVDTIYAAILALEPLADVSELTAELAKHEALVETDYTIMTWEAFAAARDAATELISSGNYSETAVGEKLMALISAAEALALKATDEAIAALKAMYDEAEALEADDYTSKSFASLRSARREASSCVSEEARDHVSAAQCEEATKLMRVALDGLKERADLDVLQAIVDECLSISANKYTEESYAVLSEAIEAARAFIEKGENDASAEEAEKLGAAITAAKDALAERADFSAIDTKVIELEALVEAEYTAESWKALQDAIAAALALSDDASQADADAALAAIVAAADALAPAATEPLATEPPLEEGGCGGALGVTVVVTVASLGLGLTALKRKDG